MQSSLSTQSVPGVCLDEAVSPGRLRELIIQEAGRAGVGHIGSALSVADIVSALYGGILNLPGAGHPDRDRFILSKGHAALALYAALYLRGFISREELSTYCGDGSKLGVHPEVALPWIDFATGSLGQGLSFGAGSALAARRKGQRRRAFVLMSDAELNEGSVWEAIMFAAHHRLSNLVAIIDLNGQQAFGYTREVMHLKGLSERLASFGWDVHNVDGHSTAKLASVVRGLDTANGAPHALIAHTTFGKGVSFMERQIKWHYSPLSPSEYEQALAEIRRAG